MKKLNHEEFIKVIENKLDEYQILSKYHNSRTKIEVKHIKCGNIFMIRPNDFKNLKSCPNCRKNKKLDQNTFDAKIKELVGDKYTFLEPYINSSTHMKVRHNVCGYIYRTTSTNFISTGSRCKKCKGLLLKTDNEFKKEIKELVGDEYTFLEPYINNNTHIKVKHNTCGKEYKVTPTNFISNNSRCRFCYGSIRKEYNEFKKEVDNLTNGEYELKSKFYINNKYPLEIIHKKCGYVYTVKPYLFINGTRCPNCNKSKIPTTEEYYKKVKELTNGEYELLENQEYINSYTKMNFIHHKCKKIFPMNPNDFTNGNRCPHCRKSKGEKIISDYLDLNSIKYETEKVFEDLKLISKLRFDFAIKDDNDNIIKLIEFDGIQHFESRSLFKERALEEIHYRDSLKNKYCIENRIDLIRIRYDEIKNITDILDSIFQKRSTTIENFNTLEIKDGIILNEEKYYNKLELNE